MAEEKEGKKKLPTAIKRSLQNERRRLHNRSIKSRVKTAIRSLETAITKNEASVIKQNLSLVYKCLDKGVKKGIFKKNMAARLKSRLSLRSLSPKA